jgi:hypothetical protein
MSKEIIPIDRIAQSIYLLREQKVMLGQDLALLYGVTLGALTQAVKRNANRFPKDFVFQLTVEEFTDLKSQFVISNEKTGSRLIFQFGRSKGRGGRRHMPSPNKASRCYQAC